MSSSTLPPAFGTRLGATALTVLAAAGFTCLAAPSAMAVGEAGDIRIHREHVPPGVSKDDPVACRFYLDAANFGELPAVTYTIKARPPVAGTATVTGTITLTNGAGHTDTLGLAEGSYTLEWALPAGTPPPTTKVFKIHCDEDRHRGNEGPNRPITDDGREFGAANGRGGGGQNGTAQGAGGREGGGQGGGAWNGEKGGPEGGVHAGGGGLADTSQAFTPLAATAAVGLVAVGGVAYFRLTRRRNHGAA
ncbi:hypothetical protein PYK79_53950 [Streptomyces sp. ID05-04B]|uniref:hypothetical protein n=1 Tax=unclassified Streptomyces TaxID=2593676 RepID=UPI000D1A806C|nr:MULTISPECIES: hypothetical protein [unclassified Streptomyces]AVV43511.1 hypothetical protein C6376_20755 [Streptomyces sp. P3]MDX5570418.1 hypothetical protein [Streptomyces sp. ID05-04B]